MILTRLQKVDQHLLLEFQGNHSMHIPISELRYLCPCAHCVSETTGERLVKREDIRSDIEILDMQIVGRYAYRILFSDGHDDGLFTVEYLEECAKKYVRN